MKLSMWNIADWLKKYNPKTEIKWGQPVIENIRLFSSSESSTSFSANILYVGYEGDFISTDRKDIVCVNKNDLLRFEFCNLYEILNELLAALDFYNHWSECLQSALTRNCQLNELLELSYEVLPFPLAVLDSCQTVLSISRRFSKGDVDSEWDNLLEKGISDIETIISFNSSSFRKSTHTKQAYFIPKGIFPCNSYSLPLYLEKNYIGDIILIEHNRSISKADLHLYQFLGSMILKWFLLYSNQNTLHLPEQYARSLFSGEDTYLADFIQYLKLQQWEEHDRMLLICMKSLSKEYNTDRHFCRLLVFDLSYTFTMVYHSFVVSIVNLSKNDPHLLFSTLTSYLKNGQYYGAMSYEFQNISDLHEHFSQSKLALSFGEPKAGRIYECGDFLMPYIFRVLKETVSVPFLHPALKTLKKYDQKRQTELYLTLFEYLKNERNQLSAAKALHIHRNTCINRLNKIQELLALNFENSDIRSHLLFSFYFEHFAKEG